METRQLAILNKKEKTLLGSLSLTQAIRHIMKKSRDFSKGQPSSVPPSSASLSWGRAGA